MFETKLHRLHYSLILKSHFFKCKDGNLQKEQWRNEKIPQLTGILWSFLPLWEEATWARYWITFLVFSVFPAPDSPLQNRANISFKIHLNNSAILCLHTSLHPVMAVAMHRPKAKAGMLRELQGICLKSLLHPKALLSFEVLIQGVTFSFIKSFWLHAWTPWLPEVTSNTCLLPGSLQTECFEVQIHFYF